MVTFESTRIASGVRNGALGRKSTIVYIKNMKHIEAFFEDQPTTSIRQMFQQLRISKISLQKIQENSRASFIQYPSVPATKGVFQKPHSQGTC